MLDFDLNTVLQQDCYTTGPNAKKNVKALIFECLLPGGKHYPKDIKQNKTLLFQHVKKFKNTMTYEENTSAYMADLLNKHYQPDLANDFNAYYAGIPKGELWRLFVDVNKQRNPAERGYVWL